MVMSSVMFSHSREVKASGRSRFCNVALFFGGVLLFQGRGL